MILRLITNFSEYVTDRTRYWISEQGERDYGTGTIYICRPGIEWKASPFGRMKKIEEALVHDW